MSFIATFSADAPRAAIYVAPVTAPYKPVASSNPSMGDDPIHALAQLGYPHHAYLFRDTMKATGYQNVPVVPVPTA